MAEENRGECRYCGKEYTKAGMVRHLQVCEQRKASWQAKDPEAKTTGYFSIWIEDKYSKDYWLAIEIREEVRLKDLDQFLRDIWLECCGHLSMFIIDGTEYDSHKVELYEWSNPYNSMNVKLKNLLGNGMKFTYEYDFGSSTDLKMKVFGYRTGAAKKARLEIMSRNRPLEMLCSECGKKPATVVCGECEWDGGGYLCDDCKTGHKCGDMYFLPVVNSPRCGVCGYEGSIMYPDE